MSSLLVFRHVATIGDESRWELRDAAAPDDQPPAGIARTRRGAAGVVHVLSLTSPDLVPDLVAALRCTDAAVISMDGGRPDLDAALRAEDFRPVFLLHL